jgi:predicted esterase
MVGMSRRAGPGSLTAWQLVAVLVGTGCALGAGLAVYRRVRGVTDAPLVAARFSTAADPDDVAADWCAPGFEPIRGGACFASGAATSEAPLIVYLHGRYARDAAAEEVDRQRRLAARATAVGFAVLAMRGRLGACTAPELASWYCWPSNENNADSGPAFVSGWTAALAAARERAGSRRRFLIGFSNGGYFSGLIVSRGLLDVDGVVVAHGGPVEPVHPLRGTPPLLLLSADDDVAQDEMIRFDEELTRERWAHDSYARAGSHGLSDLDIDAALSFFARVGEALPLNPPLPLHRAVRHLRDAGADSPTQVDDAQGGGAAAAAEAAEPGATDQGERDELPGED